MNIVLYGCTFFIHDLYAIRCIVGGQRTYQPQGDSQPERFNRTLLDMLGRLTLEQKQYWSKPIAAIVHAYK